MLQCTNVNDTPDDPSGIPQIQIYRDGSSPSLVQTIQIPAELRGVETGLFRYPLFLGDQYANAGRYLIVFKWNDSAGMAHVKTAAMHILPGGSADGSVIAMFQSNRPDASHLLFQCDSGRIIRKANPR